MSPLLFILVMEYLTHVLRWYVENLDFRFHPGCKHLGTNTLYFDDNFIFLCKANNKALKSFLDGFQLFFILLV